MVAATRNAVEKSVKSSGVPPNATSGGTMSGAAMEAIRPIPAAAPVPVPRRWVGKISGLRVVEGAPRAEVEE